MLERVLADVVVAAHFTFVAFVVLGGLLVLRWPRAAWVHVPAALWGVVVITFGLICPLTPLEQSLRRAGGESGYAGSFIDRYLVPVLYPRELTRSDQVALGLGTAALNLLIYGTALRRRRRR